MDLLLFSNSYTNFVCRMDKRENANNLKKNYVSEINVPSLCRFLSHCKIGSNEKKLNFEVSITRFGLLKDNIGWLSLYPTCSSFMIRSFLEENTKTRNWKLRWYLNFIYWLQNLKFWEKRSNTKSYWEIARERKEEKNKKNRRIKIDCVIIL